MREGTALALVCAYVLAGEIKRSAHYAEAFHTYEARVRPYVPRFAKGMNSVFVRLIHA
ncbi:MAG: hypothetical protein ABF617_13260 [Gluconobacter japonicus]|uniref:hypothetical protein n=1 Tax=Gluconobacter japonicus TaxID=376620 RepID=UPI000ACDA5A5